MTEGDMVMANGPKFYACTVKERGTGKKPMWTRIGVAWSHEQGGHVGRTHP
jgi:hypothetical protein